jgi:hypothetical protein
LDFFCDSNENFQTPLAIHPKTIWDLTIENFFHTSFFAKHTNPFANIEVHKPLNHFLVSVVPSSEWKN